MAIKVSSIRIREDGISKGIGQLAEALNQGWEVLGIVYVGNGLSRAFLKRGALPVSVVSSDHAQPFDNRRAGDYQ